ncbi:MAG: leucine-rich repeat protein [Clostridia bacterium]|nr:leucine-rich repeat protein [Clostridia bacterium]
MNLPPIICANCGRIYDLPEHLSHGPCLGCGTVNCRPQAEGESLDRLQRATRLRLEGNHDEALKCYEHVLVDYDDEHAALWGKLLCQYGVDYVTDPKTGVRHATVHVPRNRPMQLHADFSRACELAPEEVRAQYEADAAYVDEALAEINRHKESSPPYDVFICHKTTHLTGPGYTEDYNRGVQLTMLLTGMGYRVFFAPLSGLTPGAGYEAGIYYALWSAKVMLLVSSDVAFLTSPWVKSEWTRYLEMLDDGADKHLIPLMYDRLADGRMPREIRLRRLQSIRMDSDLDAKDKLLAAVAKFTGKGTPVPVQQPLRPVEEPVAQPEPVKPEMVADLTPSVPDAREVSAPARQQAAPERPVKQQQRTAVCAPKKDFGTEAVDGGVSITTYTGPGGEVVIPASIGGKKVVKIGYRAFDHRRALTKVVIPDGVTQIGISAFSGCSALTEVVIPDGVTRIEDNAFSDCSALKEIRLPGKLEYLGVFAFSRCCMTGVRIPDGLQHIGRNPFLGNGALRKIAVSPENKTFYTSDDVLFCRNGTLVCYPGGKADATYDVPEDVREISPYAFVDCSALTALTIPAGVKKVGVRAISGCDKLTLRVHENSAAHKYAQKGKLPFELIQTTAPEGHFTTDTVDGGVSITRYTGPGGEVVIPASIGGKKVVEIGKKAFEDCLNLHGVVIPEGVTAIGDWAFYRCGNLKDVRIPGSVKCIGHYAFYGTGLTKVQIPQGVTKIESNVFYYCSDLESVSLPDSLKEIGDYAFAGTGLTKVEIPAGVTVLGGNPFASCAQLKTITVAAGNGTFSVRDNVLFGAGGVLVCFPAGVATAYAIPEGVTAIGKRAFSGCTGLAGVTFPASVTTIRMSAFHGCTGLKKVTVPETVTAVDSLAFRDCSHLTLRVHENSAAHRYAQKDSVRFELIAPAQPAVKPEKQPESRPAAQPVPAWAPESHFATAAADGGVRITGYTGPGGEVLIPPTIGGKQVVGIGEEAFKMQKSLTNLVFPEGVTSIGKRAINFCSRLESVSIPESLVQLDIDGQNPFAHCPALKSITVAEGNRKYRVRDNVLLSHDRELLCYPAGLSAASYTIPDFVTSIAGLAFHCSKLKTVSIPESVTRIGAAAFSFSTQLTDVRIPTGVRSIEDMMFQGCGALASVSIPEHVTHIGDWAFKDCPNLTLRVHADTPAHKFVQQNNLRFEVIAAAQKPVQPVGERLAPSRPAVQPAPAYAPESHFATAAVDGGVSITRYFGPGGEVVIPASIGGKTVVEIGEDAFGDCGKITKMTIPTSVQIIGDYALQSCSGLTYLSIPEGVKQIGNFAFRNCTGLAEVYISESVERIGTNPFAGCTALKSIRVSDKNMHYNARRSELLMRTLDGFLICCPAGVYRGGTYKLLETVRKIGSFAFQGCTMTRIDINPGVQTIANYAFRECSQLTCVSIPETVRRIGTDAFEHSPRLRLIVPKGSDAHNYARMHGLNYEAVGLISRLFGKK